MVIPDSLRLIQANISTLNPREALQSTVLHGLSATPRTVLLDSLFADADVVFIQEGRLPGEGVQKCFNFIMFRAPATAGGSGGSQVWIQRKLARHIVSSKVFSPWLLRVVLAFGPFQVHLLSGHAPFVRNSADSRAARRDFWKLYSDAIAESVSNRDAIVLSGIDANARVGDVDVRCYSGTSSHKSSYRNPHVMLVIR